MKFLTRARPQAAADDGRTDAFPADHLVVVASVVDLDNRAVDDTDYSVTIEPPPMIGRVICTPPVFSYWIS